MEREAAWDLRLPRLSGVNLKSLHVASFWLVGIACFIAFAVAFEWPCKKLFIESNNPDNLNSHSL